MTIRRLRARIALLVTLVAVTTSGLAASASPTRAEAPSGFADGKWVLLYDAALASSRLTGTVSGEAQNYLAGGGMFEVQGGVALLVGAMAACSSSNSHASGATPTSTKSTKRVFPGVTLLTAESGGGVRPTLRWQRVSGAARYRVVVLDARGRPYWAWGGPSTSVPVGGGPKAVARGSGTPRLGSGFSWSVAALDARGRPVALSESRAISP